MWCFEVINNVIYPRIILDAYYEIMKQWLDYLMSENISNTSPVCLIYVEWYSIEYCITSKYTYIWRIGYMYYIVIMLPSDLIIQMVSHIYSATCLVNYDFWQLVGSHTISCNSHQMQHLSESQQSHFPNVG